MAFYESERVFIGKQDWSLHRRGPLDEQRLNEKVKEAIKGDLPTIVSDGTIITADPTTKRIIKVPLRSLELPHIRHSQGDKNVGTGDGSEEEGDVIATDPSEGDGNGPGAGDQPGIPHYEVELTLEELQEMVFEDLGLPDLKPRARQIMETDELVFDDIRKKRTTANLDLRRTIFENLKRNAQQSGEAVIRDVNEDDFRTRTWNLKERESQAAVVIAMRDISGSMGDFENYIVRSFCWWTVLFLRSRYPHVEMVFIVHDTEATEVTEEEFFKRGSSGGTKCSSANELALRRIRDIYSTDQYNVYPLHFSDGDNYGSEDDQRCVSLIKEMLLMGINQYGFVHIAKQTSSLTRAYQTEIQDERFAVVMISKKEEIWQGLQKIFDKEKEFGGQR